MGGELEPGSRARTAASVGALAALMVAGGYVLSGIPNVEVMTLIAFTGGWLAGVGGGAVVGILGMALFTAANPYGAAVPLVAAAQVGSMGLVGACGGHWGKSGEAGRRVPSALRLGAQKVILAERETRNMITTHGPAASPVFSSNRQQIAAQKSRGGRATHQARKKSQAANHYSLPLSVVHRS